MNYVTLCSCIIKVSKLNLELINANKSLPFGRMCNDFFPYYTENNASRLTTLLHNEGRLEQHVPSIVSSVNDGIVS